MNIEQLTNSLPDYAKDIKLNVSTILSETGSQDLTQKQIYFIALTCAYACKNKQLITALEKEVMTQLSADEINAAKSAAIIMAMNNVYYRFIHLVNDSAFRAMPAKLRMNVIANPGIDKIDFELMCLAISAINGCGMCIEAHTHALTKTNVSKEAIQSTIRIASVINALALSIDIAANMQ